MNSSTLVVIGVVIMVSSSVAAEVTCDPHWQPGFHLPGFDGDVHALLVHDDGSGPALFVGGYFSAAGALNVKSIARWDGQAWSNVGGGVGFSDPDNAASVNALCVYDDGNGPALIAGGTFSKAGSISASKVARWNGREWSALSSVNFPSTAHVHALEPFDDGTGPALFVGGRFVKVGSQVVNHIAKWNGVQWSPLAPGISSTGAQTPGVMGVFALKVYDDGSGPALYVGGDIKEAGGLFSESVVRWDGASWTSVGGGIVPIDDEGTLVRALQVFDDGSGQAESLFVGGRFSTAGNTETRRIARWNGSTWSALGEGLYSVPHQIWDTVAALSIFDDGQGAALYAGGHFERAGDGPAAAIAKWNGRAWSALGDGVHEGSINPAVRALAAFDAGSGPMLMAGGLMTQAGEVGTARLAAWDGKNWSAPIHGLGPMGFVNALERTEIGDDATIFAAGSFESAGTVLAHSIAAFDGREWSALGNSLLRPPPNGTCTGSFQALESRVKDGAVQLFAGGVFVHVGSVAANYIASWDGDHWAPLGEGLGIAEEMLCLVGVYDMELLEHDGGFDLYVAGVFDHAGGAPAKNIARWDGESWHALGDGLEGLVLALHVDPDSDPRNPIIYAGGRFILGHGKSYCSVARWDGKSWEEVGAGLDLYVYDILMTHDLPADQETMYVAGGLDPIVARWDGESWTTSGFELGRSGSVGSLAIVDFGCGPQLVAGGDLDYVGDVLVRGIVVHDGSAWQPIDGGVSAAGQPYSERVNEMIVVPGATGDRLYVGGGFEQAGQTPSGSIAMLPLARSGPGSADLSGDGSVDGIDLALLLGAWGRCAEICPADLDGDGVVNGIDLAMLLAAWG